MNSCCRVWYIHDAQGEVTQRYAAHRRRSNKFVSFGASLAEPPPLAETSTLNIQPVIPPHLNRDWNLITRTILPLIWQPSLRPAQTVPFGTGPITFSAFLSPRNAVDGWVWGIGPVVQVPTVSSNTKTH